MTDDATRVAPGGCEVAVVAPGISRETAPVGGELPGGRRADSPLDVGAEYAYPLYRRLLADRRDFVLRVDAKLDEALRDTTVELFLSRALAVGLLAGVGAWLAGLAVGYLFVLFVLPGMPILIGVAVPEFVLAVTDPLKIPALIVGSGLLFGLAGLAAGFGGPILDLYYVSYMRRMEINRLLPDAIAYMYALSAGGMNHIEILDAVAEAEEVYGEVSREFQTIVQETAYFDTDYRTAIHNRAVETPSQPLNQFFTDLLSILSSGGDVTRFLDEKADRHLDIAKREQEEVLDTLELFGEMYLAISLFPILLIILLVVMALVGQGSQLLLYVAVYGFIPVIGLLFLVLISTVKRDEQTEGYLSLPGATGRDRPGEPRPLARVAERYRGRHPVFGQIDRRELLHRVRQHLARPHRLFVSRPLATLLVTVPICVVYLAYVVLAGIGPQSAAALAENAVSGTVLYVYVPLYVTMLPLAVFHEWYVRHRYGILDDLTETLRKLSSANDTGLTLLESFRTVADTSASRLAGEFDRLHVKVTYGMALKRALVELNNTYHVPRFARIVKLVAEAQETSSHITDVLTTAAQASENQDEIARSRRARTRMQIAIILMTFFTLLGVMAILKVQFLDVIARIVETSETSTAAAGIAVGSNVDVALLSLLFFHAVTLQAVASSFIAGYLRSSNLLSGAKYLVVLQTVALVVWIVVA